MAFLPIFMMVAASSTLRISSYVRYVQGTQLNMKLELDITLLTSNILNRNFAAGDSLQ